MVQPAQNQTFGSISDLIDSRVPTQRQCAMTDDGALDSVASIRSEPGAMRQPADFSCDTLVASSLL
jgi:hypothetical protein